MLKQIFFAGLVVVSLLGSWVYFLSLQDPVLARVGSTKIHASQAAYQDQIIRLYYPEEKRSMGLYQLIKSAYNLEILKNNGVEVGDSQLLLEEERINTHSRDQEQLKKIKNIFGGDQEAYRRIFVRSTLVDRSIYYEFFLTNPEIHKESLRQVREVIRQAREERLDLRTLAQRMHLSYRRLEISSGDGLLAAEKKHPRKASALKKDRDFARLEDPRWFNMVLLDLAAGEVAPVPVDSGEEWLVVRCLAKDVHNTSAKIEVISVAKLEFSQWYESEKNKIPVKVYDKNYLVP